jgi:hypothetical protein
VKLSPDSAILKVTKEPDGQFLAKSLCAFATSVSDISSEPLHAKAAVTETKLKVATKAIFFNDFFISLKFVWVINNLKTTSCIRYIVFLGDFAAVLWFAG